MTTAEFATLLGAKYVGELPSTPDGFLGAANAVAFFQQRRAQLNAEENCGKAKEIGFPKIEVAINPETFIKLVELAKETKIAPEKMAEEIMEHFFKALPTAPLPQATMP